MTKFTSIRTLNSPQSHSPLPCFALGTMVWTHVHFLYDISSLKHIKVNFTEISVLMLGQARLCKSSGERCQSGDTCCNERIKAGISILLRWIACLQRLCLLSYTRDQWCEMRTVNGQGNSQWGTGDSWESETVWERNGLENLGVSILLQWMEQFCVVIEEEICDSTVKNTTFIHIRILSMTNLDLCL